MNAIDLMMEEHRLIEKVLGALERFVSHEASWTEADRQTLGRFVRFIREYADACHHAKEEDVLFAEMEGAGFPKESGPIGAMRSDHDLGRRLAGVMARAAEASGEWTDSERAETVRAARAYIGLLREHIQKEDGILYPMARSHLDAASMARVDEICLRKEETARAAGTKPELEALARELIGSGA